MTNFGETELGRRLASACQLSPTVKPMLDIALPPVHQALLEECGGATAYDGYFRLFGSGSGRFGLKNWNDGDTWKFAWPKRVAQYFCFAETAWGDQYAYRLTDGVIASEQVFFLDALRMEPEALFPTFEAFLTGEFLRNASAPYDSALVSVAARLGPLPVDKHLSQVPSQLVTGIEDPGSVQTLPAIDAMVFNGDLYRQIIEARRDAPVRAVEVVGDSNGRPRLQVS